jgi:HD-GYP domain-containing protein (c-di-GMP phosphodiesterase class II)
MEYLKLNHSVHTLEKHLLLPAGTEIVPETLESLVSSRKGKSYQTHPLLKYGSIAHNLLEFISVPPYQTIFSDPDVVSGLMKDMENIILPVPVLDTLEYFREQDFYTYRHVLMVSVLSTLLAKDLLPEFHERIMLAATGPTHDIGKICVPSDILKKKTPLTRAEHDCLNHHTKAGYVLLSYYLQDAQHLASKVARDHHERRDGSGHPCGIEQMELLIEIIAVCDIYDALISSRPYRPVSYDNRTAIEEISNMAERKIIGWDIVKALVARSRKTRVHFTECMISEEKRGKPPKGNVYGLIMEDGK